MSLRDCVAKLVAEGKITKKVAQEALSLNERAKGKVSREIPPASLDAASALIAAKTLRETADNLTRNVSANVHALRNAEVRMAEHPGGSLGAINGMNTRDLWRNVKAWRDLPADSPVKTGANVEGVKEATKRQAESKFAEGLKSLTPGFWGQGGNALALLRNMTYELFDHDTGDATAKTIAKAWDTTTGFLRDEAHAAGKIFDVIEDWRVPQSWTQWRVKNFGPDEWRRDVLGHVNSGALTLWDRDTGRPGEPLFLTDRAFTDISRNGGPTAPFSREQRTFVFSPGKAGADAYLQMMEKYGHGTNQMLAMMGHIDHASQEIGLVKVWGPNHDANFDAAMQQALDSPKPPITTIGKYHLARVITNFLESENNVRATYKVLNGYVHPVHDDWISSLLASSRNMMSASMLKMATLTNVPSDAVTQALAAHDIGINPFKQVLDVFTPGGVGGKLSVEDAARLHMDASAVVEFANGIRQFEDQLSAFQISGKMASAVVKATFLDMWNKNGKRTWGQNVLSLFGRHRNETFEQLAQSNPRFRQALDNYGFNADDWKVFQGNVSEVNRNAFYLDPNKLMLHPEHYDRVMNMIQETSAFAVDQQDARLRATSSGLQFGVNPGKMQEATKLLFQFKTFGLSRLTTHVFRALTDADMSSRIGRGTAFLLLSIGAGAMGMQAYEVASGKDLKPMDTVSFWLKSLARSGGGGIFFDMVANAVSGDGNPFGVAPFGSLITDTINLLTAPAKRAVKELDGEHVPLHGGRNFGSQASKMLRTYTPDTWYAKLAVERFIFDKIQQMIDPEWRKSFRRMQYRQKHDYKSDYWWAPGKSTPDHTPRYPSR